MTLTQQTDPYLHWEFVHPASGDWLRIVPSAVASSPNGVTVIATFFTSMPSGTTTRPKAFVAAFPCCFRSVGRADDVLPLNEVDYTCSSTASPAIFPGLRLLEDQTGISLSLSDTEATRASYPFSFLIEMQVRPVAQALEISISILNRSEQTMPFSFGYYFNVTDPAEVELRPE